MFGLFGKKPKPSNGWVRLGVREIVPAKTGQKIDLRLRDGDEVYGLIYGRPRRGVTARGAEFVYKGIVGAHWNLGNRPHDVVAYRLHEPDADAAQRAARLALFNGLRRAAEKTGRVTVPDHRPEEAPPPVDACASPVSPRHSQGDMPEGVRRD